MNFKARESAAGPEKRHSEPILAWILLAVFLLWPGNCVAGPVTPTSSDRPAQHYNLVLVTIDTLRADHVGAYGYTKVDTPNLDGLAKSGVLFENAVSQVPLTPPSHASMFTGTYPTVHKVRDTGGFILADAHLTLAEFLEEQGWNTAAFIGSMVLGRMFGLDQGFKTYDDRIHATGKGEGSFDFPYRRAEEVIDNALNWLGNQKSDDKIFLWVHLFDPHRPYDPPPDFRRQYESAYDGEISYADKELGRLFAEVKRKFSNQNTLSVVLSDHGEALSDHGEYTHGVFLYESTIRIPWIMAGPGIPAGVRFNQQARTIDLMPTLLALMGFEIPDQCQGVSLVPAFRNPRTPTGSTYSYTETLFPKINMGWAELRAMRTNRWKYVRAPKPELYDLEKDPLEKDNVIKRFPAVARRLDNQIQEVISTGSGEEEFEVVHTTALDQETIEELKALGYVSLGTPRTLELTGEGIDPKDRLRILQLLEEATTGERDVPQSRRLQALEQAKQEDPSNTTVYYRLGEAYEHLGRDEDALKLYEEAIDRGLPAANKIYIRMAAIYGRKNELDESIRAFEKAIEIDSTDTETQNRLALVYLMKKQTDDARRLLQGVLVLDEENAKAHNSLGWLEAQLGNVREAKIHFQMAIDFDPEFLETYVNLGMLLKRTQEYHKARPVFEEFLGKAANQEKYRGSVERVKAELNGLPEK